MTNRTLNYHEFRAQYPWFSFDEVNFLLDEQGLSVTCQFSLAGKVNFSPTLFVPRKPWFLPDELILPYLPAVLFHIGMVELISYWKAACPPDVIIRPFRLNHDQISWWKELYWNGLGEFFYLNGIDTAPEEFMSITTGGGEILVPAAYPVTDGVIVPVGGGKDSAVTLELLAHYPRMIPMIMNPRKASLNTIRIRGFSDPEYIEVHRSIDPALLELNSRGYLNGHTPFSALLAFISLLVSLLSGRKYIALSNESSASEPTIPGTHINHQYSKSLQFETAFRKYVHEFITPDAGYFSFLRPLNELQIASVFADLTAYHPVFRSCNAGSKTDSWCGRCPKCMFTAIILSPFLDDRQLSGIFGKDMFEDPELTSFLDQLCGNTPEKPFECVGTVREVNLALCEAIRQRSHTMLPLLLRHYRNSAVWPVYAELDFSDFLKETGTDHHVPPLFYNILKKFRHD